MARNHGRIFASLWDDEDFIATSIEAKAVFSFLVSQPDLAHSGVIGIRIPPWARRLNTTHARLDTLLDELHAAGFIVVDRDEMQLLVRSLVRRDGVYKQPNVFKSAAENIYMVASKPIRRTLLSELQRLDESEMNAETRKINSDLVDWLRKGSGNPSPNPSGKGSEKGSENPSEDHSSQNGQDGQGADNTAGDKGSENPSGNPPPRAPTHARVPLPLSPTTDPFPEPLTLSTPPASDGDPARPTFDDFWTAYPRKVAKGNARKAWVKAIKSADPAEILAGVERYSRHCERTRKAAQFTRHAASWLNGECWDDAMEDAPPPDLRLVSNGHQTYRDPDPAAYYDPKAGPR